MTIEHTGAGRIEPIDIDREMKDSFLEYAMSVIVARALPDVRDGLKPVHRRILYAMEDAGMRAGTPYRKCARVVGDVMSWFHPHSNDAIYDALVRLGQDFSSRYPLIDPQGNFGSVDDPPAAMRYCVTGDTLVRTVDGTQPIASLADAPPDSEVDIDVKVLDRRGNPVRATKFFHSGRHPTLRLRTREGFEITGTANHPLLCLVPVAGVPMLLWRTLEEIQPQDRVVVSRSIAPPDGAATETSSAAAFLAGAWVAEGWASESRAGFNNTDPEYFSAVVQAYDAVVGGSRDVTERRLPSGKLLQELDIQNLTRFAASPLAELAGAASGDKAIPDFVLRSSADAKRSFLAALFEGDGSCSALGSRALQVSYSTRSTRLAHDVQRLLLEFGVVGRIAAYASGEFKVFLSNKRDISGFAERVGFWGRKQRKLDALLEPFQVKSRSLSGDHIPFLAAFVRAEAGRGGLEWLKKHNIDRVERWELDGDLILSKIADPGTRAIAETLVEHGYYYATVDSIEPAGTADVYSIRVDSDDHSFLANGFVNHNTECRLAPLSAHMVAGLDEDTVEWADNYSGERQEPTVLPARFPNLLVNGSTGIAVGMATNIPPHNLGEVIDAVLHTLEHPDANSDDLMQYVQGPDFPTGGFIVGRRGLRDALLTGRGTVKMRANTEIAEIRPGRTGIVVSAIPYQVSRDRIMERIATLVKNKTITGISDIRDESDREGTRLVIELKKDAVPRVVENQLYKLTQLQENFSVNMVALVDGVPRTLGLSEMIGYYVDHQMEVIERRTRYRLQKAKDRAHIVEGLLIALDNIDEVVSIIRGSSDTEAARGALMERFSLSEVQATHILDMPLRRLTQLETSKLQDEHRELMATIEYLEGLLADPAKRRALIAEELAEIREKYADDRRTRIVPDEGDLSLEDLIADDDLVVTVTDSGYLKSTNASSYRRQGRGGRGVRGAKLTQDDVITRVLHTTAHAWLLFFTNRGKVYRVKAHEIPRKERTAKGVLAQSVLPLEPDERIEAIVDTRDYETARYLVMVTKKGQVKKTKFSEYDSRNSVLIAISLDDDDEVVAVRTTNGEHDLLLFTRHGMGIRFPEGQVRPMGRDTRGVRGIKLRAGDEVVSAATQEDGDEVLLITSGGYGKRTRLSEFRPQQRGGVGLKAIKLTRVRGELVGARAISPDQEIFLTSSVGEVIRIAVSTISRQKRDATGVRVMTPDGDAQVSAFAPIPQENGDEEE